MDIYIYISMSYVQDVADKYWYVHTIIYEQGWKQCKIICSGVKLNAFCFRIP